MLSKTGEEEMGKKRGMKRERKGFQSFGAWGRASGLPGPTLCCRRGCQETQGYEKVAATQRQTQRDLAKRKAVRRREGPGWELEKFLTGELMGEVGKTRRKTTGKERGEARSWGQ